MEQRLQSAHVAINHDEAVAHTGVVTRAWSITRDGLATRAFFRVGDDATPLCAAQASCDWSLRGLITADEPARLISLDARGIQDVNDTSDHLLITAHFRYENTGFDLRYTIRVYPGAPGFHTQLALMPTRAFTPDQVPSYLGDCRSERLVLASEPAMVMAAGYYNDTQHRNYDHTPILQTREWPGSSTKPMPIDWANLIAVERDGRGLALVKESHKCVNAAGIDTGAFLVSKHAVEVTGLGLTPTHYGGGFWADNLDRWRECWATWSVLYTASDTADTQTSRQLAIKQMDRLRFPFRTERDRLIMANTWGSGGAGEGSRRAAEQTNVLRELQSAADLGIEIVQIDDGWQAEPDDPKPTAGEKPWQPNPTRWPEGWDRVRAEADRVGVDLGLWFPWYVEAEKIAWNLERGGFRRIKLDFMGLGCRHDIEKISAKVEALVARFGPTLGINWDATELTPRMGYYFGREHGNIYLENRENGPPPLTYANHIRYTPRLVLRDAWHLAHYMNLNQLQLTIQNKDRVVADLSNCRDYPHDYCFAITMMGLPLFFQETHYYSEAARRELRSIIQLYKQHRDAMLRGFVFRIGQEPNDHAWTGFQSHQPDTGSGYLIVFREVHNTQDSAQIILRFAGDREVSLTDLRSGQSDNAQTQPDGGITFHLPEAASFGFYRYEFTHRSRQVRCEQDK